MTTRTFTLPDITTTTFWAIISVIGLMTIVVLCFAVGWFFIPKSSTVPSEITAVAEQQQPVQREVIPAPQAVAKVAPEPVKEKSPVPTSSRYPNIFEAARSGSVDDMRYFLAQGVDINGARPIVQTRGTSPTGTPISSSIGGETPLYLAVINNSNDALDVVKFLVSQGADVNRKGAANLSPLEHVLLSRSAQAVEIATFLVSQGADVANGSRGTPLHFAAMFSPSAPINIEVFRYLTTVSDVNAISIKATNMSGRNVVPENRTPLDVANTEEKKEILRAAGAKFAKEL